MLEMDLKFIFLISSLKISDMFDERNSYLDGAHSSF